MSEAETSSTGRPSTAGELGLMRGSPPPPEARVTLANWQDYPMNRWSFLHVGQLMPTARISRGHAPIAPLPEAPRNLDSVSFEAIEGERLTLAQWLERTCTDGFLVLHRGAIVVEHYFNDTEPDTLHLLKSVSKSITGALAGALVGARLLIPERPLTDYVPEFAGTSLEGGTVRHALDMLMGTRFSEDYGDPNADIAAYESAVSWLPSAPNGPQPDLFDYILSLQNAYEHGTAFQYRSIITDVLALILERASGLRFADALSRYIWRRLGAEYGAEVCVDRHGTAIADGGISCTLRDLGRFGQMYLQSGRFNGRQIVPVEWVLDTRYGDGVCRGAFGPCDQPRMFPEGHYRNQWWAPDPRLGILLASGIYGQSLYLNMTAGVVIAKLSSLPRAADLNILTDDLLQFGTIAAALNGSC